MPSSRDHWWYSPAAMLTFADRALAQCAAHGSAPSGELQKAIGEGRAGAIFALSLGKVLGVETWMRLVHPREGAPDVRVMYLESSGPRGSNRMMTLQVEVATFTLHSSEELSEFIFNKKLDPTKKAYASNTAILIYVQRGCTPQDIQAAHEYLADKGGRQSCYLVGMLPDRRWQVAQVAPNLRGPVTVDLAEALESGQAPVAQSKRGMSALAVVAADPTATPNPYLDRL